MLGAAALPQSLDRGWIAQHLRHAGAMCLIDGVTAWSDDAIVCRTRTHRRGDNPLRAADRLGAMSGVEYGAQAAAVHGAILACREAGGPRAAVPSGGFLAALRGVESRVDRLDAFAGELEIAATRVAALAGGATYDYTIRHASALLQAGRLTLAFAPLQGAGPGAQP